MPGTITRAQAYEESENVGRNPTDNPTIGDVIAARLDRRDILKGALGVAAIAATVSPLALAAATRASADVASRFRFEEIEAGIDETHHVAAGYDADLLIGWGDPVLPGAPAFNPRSQTAASQRMQFGYNSDFLAYFPMPGAANPSHHGLLVVNHEYTNEELMFPGLRRQDVKDVAFAEMTPDLVDIEMAAHGGAVIEIMRENGKWRVVQGSKYARRSTPIRRWTSPARRRAPAPADADPSGAPRMINNCAGGVTPWGTWLTCEENSRLFPASCRTVHAEAPILAWGNSTASISARSRTKQTGLGGSWRSIRSIRRRPRRNAPRSAASNTRALPASSIRTDAM